ncbi:uncharacterized mitochondrial protein AtMg00810-like [Carya illinoinensis]|uniref:uncharacterized mitochondrial protein AtMg00810-like n=1 Tax=Carya illinoinensis TaxID=32201 RepID=UPI001C71BEC3|nr:uncharacterized mitochondrial protein AtMg00810-like [Carya illinoinensis]
MLHITLPHNLVPRIFLFPMAIEAEIEVLENNHTWTLTDLPKGKFAIDCKYVYKVKFNLDGTLERLKVRLVAKGYTQREEIDHVDTFSPVAKLVFVRFLLSIAAIKGWFLHHFDITNAFLNGELKEEIYMKKPPSYNKSTPHQVCKLLKSSYGLKQASRQWNYNLTSSLLDFGFKQSKSDYTLFTKHEADSYIAILIYVDDILVASNSNKAISTLRTFLNLKFKVRDLGCLRYFLGLEVARSSKWIHLCQKKYVLDILSYSGMLGCKPLKIPLDQNFNISKEDSNPITDPSIFRRLIGRLLYLTITRPDICFSVQVLSQFMDCPNDTHLAAAYRILRYLKAAPGQGILLSSSSQLQLRTYCDSDWASCPDSRRSTIGYCIFLGDSLVSWKSKKQTVVSRSSVEAEYRVMVATCLELTWLHYLLTDLGFHHP